ncbi:WhiB family transcriptional regulator [Streptomyces sp. NPDC056656]|uniref:WhiB family transcriptional regulator n=1 Tax=Streptomyces sp. NPDC056656 TaxID=3345895 RepID=UPI0036C44F6E
MPFSGPRDVKQCVDRVGAPFPRSDQPPQCSADPNLFQTDYDGPAPGSSQERRVRLAKRVCIACPIAETCLKWALVNEELALTGIWGATTVRERNALRGRLFLRLGPEWITRLTQEHGRACLRDEVREQRARTLTRSSARGGTTC